MKPTPNLKTIEAALCEAALKSGKTLMAYFGKRSLRVSEKKGAGLVTEADFKSEKAAMAVLKKAAPSFQFLTEETSPEQKEQLRNTGRFIIDPLDGTTNFVHGFPMFCVSLAAEWNGEIIAGVIYHPVLKHLYTAVTGKGAFLNGKRIHVSETRKLSDALLTTGFSYRKDLLLTAEMHAFERLSSHARAIRRPGSAALDLAYVASGVFDGFWERRLSPWDVAAGAILVKEAGGKVTDFQGKPFRLSNPELLASNGKLHPVLRRDVRVALDPRK
jgi:myo-inositol-1(or 4)-monophosphatase